MDLFGQSRSHLARDHALIEPASFVSAALPGWERTQGVIVITPVLGARFTQYFAVMESSGRSAPAAAGIERLAYVLEGEVKLGTSTLTPGGFAFLPPGDDAILEAVGPCRLNIFEKRYQPHRGIEPPKRIVGREQDVEGRPFLGDPAARLQTLLPDEPQFDMAVNVFRFEPGAALPLVEVHVMEHGLLMIAGQGVYRLADGWYPVKAGDVIWMASFCPQWFVAMGKERAGYLYYKDINRDPGETLP